MTDLSTQRPPAHGFALPSVLVMLLLGSLLTLSVWRNLVVNEQGLQARADMLQTQWQADATLLAALDDVLQRRLDAGRMRHTMGDSIDTHVFFPSTPEELRVLRQQLGQEACREGLCAPLQPLISKPKDWQGRIGSAMAMATAHSKTDSNPGERSHYWVEIFLTDTPEASWVYRITVMHIGRKSVQPILLQGIWLANTHGENTSESTDTSTTTNSSNGHWISWAVLHGV